MLMLTIFVLLFLFSACLVPTLLIFFPLSFLFLPGHFIPFCLPFKTFFLHFPSRYFSFLCFITLFHLFLLLYMLFYPSLLPSSSVQPLPSLSIPLALLNWINFVKTSLFGIAKWFPRALFLYFIFQRKCGNRISILQGRGSGKFLSRTRIQPRL